jgi:hypothetical protein
MNNSRKTLHVLIILRNARRVNNFSCASRVPPEMGALTHGCLRLSAHLNSLVPCVLSFEQPARSASSYWR